MFFKKRERNCLRKREKGVGCSELEGVHQDILETFRVNQCLNSQFSGLVRGALKKRNI